MTKKAFQAYGTQGRITKPTAREAAVAYFEAHPKSRKCNVVEGIDDGNFFTVAYGRRSQGEWPKSYKDVTRKTMLDIKD